MSKQALADAIDRTIMPGMQGDPFMNSIAAKAIAFYEAATPEFKIYQQQIIKNAAAMAQAMKDLGYRIVADGTENHLFIVDLRSVGVSGRDAEMALDKAGITVSRSCIPFDPAKPWITSGIRLGTPAMTTRGMEEREATMIAQWVDYVVKHHTDETQLQRIKKEVARLCEQFPAYR